MTEQGPRDLRAVIEEAAAELEGVERVERGALIEWSTNGVAFSTVAEGRAEFRLAPAVVAAALRTPDTEPSPRGGDWVAFAPTGLDGHAIDRATAWLASAWRRARSGE